MEVKKLELIFKNSAGNNFTLSLDDPREDLEEQEVRESMEGIIEEDAFLVKKFPLNTAYKARTVTRRVDEIF